MKRAIVTGATGMIGCALVSHLVAHGIHVCAVAREGSKRVERLPNSPLISIARCNLSEDPQGLAETLQGLEPFDTFFHIAWDDGAHYHGGRDNAELQRRNLNAALALTECAVRLGCDTFIGAGSQAEYGRLNTRITPDAAVRPDSAYGAAKFAAGKLCASRCRELGMRFCWGRIFSVFGIYESPQTMLMYLIRQLKAGDPPELSACDQEWDYLFSADAGLAFYLLGEHGQDQSFYNIASGVSRPLREFVDITVSLVNSPTSARFGDPLPPDRRLSLNADISSLTKDTGFRPRFSFREGMAKTLDFLDGKVGG